MARKKIKEMMESEPSEPRFLTDKTLHVLNFIYSHLRENGKDSKTDTWKAYRDSEEYDGVLNNQSFNQIWLSAMQRGEIIGDYEEVEIKAATEEEPAKTKEVLYGSLNEDRVQANLDLQAQKREEKAAEAEADEEEGETEAA